MARAILPTVVDIEQLPTTAYSGTVMAMVIGSGFTYSSDGYIITNNHVVEGASSIKASLADGSTCEAKLVGELAVAAGSPEGFEQSVTSGITLTGMSQTDAAKPVIEKIIATRQL